MSVTSQLTKPSESDIQQGRYTLVRALRTEAGAAAPVTALELDGVQSWNIGQVEWGDEKEVFQQGAGDKSLKIRRDPNWSGAVSFLKGVGFTELARLLGQTWTSAGNAALLSAFETANPTFILEGVCRDDDNTTHLFSMVAPDCVIDGFSFDNPMDDTEWTLNFHTEMEPFAIPTGCEVVLDVYTGDGSTVAFTLSSTPLALVTLTSARFWSYANAIYVKEKASTASTGTFKTNYTIAGVTATAATAPAASTIVSIAYIKAT